MKSGRANFGCRNRRMVQFDPISSKNRRQRQIKMHRLQLSKGQTGPGGDPARIQISAEDRGQPGIPMGHALSISPAAHSAFTSPVQMMEFMASCAIWSAASPRVPSCARTPKREFHGVMVKAMLGRPGSCRLIV